jgi:hypothetical protein
MENEAMQPFEAAQSIQVVVEENGQVRADFSHFHGEACLLAGKQMQTLLARLGVQIDQTTFTPKPELFAAGQQEVVQTQETEQYDV